jgi:hypothetical protein
MKGRRASSKLVTHIPLVLCNMSHSHCGHWRHWHHMRGSKFCETLALATSSCTKATGTGTGIQLEAN